MRWFSKKAMFTDGEVDLVLSNEDVSDAVCGIVDGFTCGAPIAAILPNTNTRSGDYSNLKDCPRPGHADYPSQMKYKGYLLQ